MTKYTENDCNHIQIQTENIEYKYQENKSKTQNNLFTNEPFNQPFSSSSPLPYKHTMLSSPGNDISPHTSRIPLTQIVDIQSHIHSQKRPSKRLRSSSDDIVSWQISPDNSDSPSTKAQRTSDVHSSSPTAQRNKKLNKSTKNSSLLIVGTYPLSSHMDPANALLAKYAPTNSHTNSHTNNHTNNHTHNHTNANNKFLKNKNSSQPQPQKKQIQNSKDLWLSTPKSKAKSKSISQKLNFLKRNQSCGPDFFSNKKTTTNFSTFDLDLGIDLDLDLDLENKPDIPQNPYLQNSKSNSNTNLVSLLSQVETECKNNLINSQSNSNTKPLISINEKNLSLHQSNITSNKNLSSDDFDSLDDGEIEEFLTQIDNQNNQLQSNQTENTQQKNIQIKNNDPINTDLKNNTLPGQDTTDSIAAALQDVEDISEFNNHKQQITNEEIYNLNSSPIIPNDSTSNFEFEFDDLLLDDFNNIPCSAEIELTHKYTITDISLTENSTIIIASGLDYQINVRINLLGSWRNTQLFVNDSIVVIGEYPKNEQVITIDDKNFLLVVNPEILLSSSIISDYFTCDRKAALLNRVYRPFLINKATLYGKILHDVIQKSLLTRDFSIKLLSENLLFSIKENSESLYFLNERTNETYKILSEKISSISSWGSLYTSDSINAHAQFSVSDDTVHSFRIKKVLDVEECARSKIYGIKGNVDSTLEIEYFDKFNKKYSCVSPLEIKTGKMRNVVAHRLQSHIYTKLLSEKYNTDITFAILYFSEYSELQKVAPKPIDIRNMIMARNQLAYYMLNRNDFPKVSENSFLCKRCPIKKSCSIYHKVYENGTATTSALDDEFLLLTDQIKDKYKDFLLHWEDLLSLEEKETLMPKSKFLQSDIGSMGSNKHLDGLILSNESINVALLSNKNSDNKIYTFTKEINSYSTADSNSGDKLDSTFSVGDQILISDGKSKTVICTGSVSEVTTASISILTKNSLLSPVAKLGNDFIQCSPARDDLINRTYSMDKSEFSSTIPISRYNLLELLASDCNANMRRLIIDLEAPEYDESFVYSRVTERMNIDQEKALDKVMRTKDYTLIQGMPGTGKTTTIVNCIREICSQNKTVLLTSYTHSAVDNVLTKLKGHGLNILRLGNLNSLHTEVREFAKLSGPEPLEYEEYDKIYKESQVVATTVLGINHSIFLKKRFDYCIIDEASQITLPLCIGPLRLCEKFVLVGDHLQLSPLVLNPEARKKGLDISLLKLLYENHPQQAATLGIQYRMCEDIMLLSNELIYDNRLKCGNEVIKNRTLKIPNPENARNFHILPNCKNCWIENVLDPTKKVIFFNTDDVPAFENNQGHKITNDIEAKLVLQSVNALTGCGVSEKSIGIISVYRSQILEISHLLRKKKEIEVLTADRFQGRDKDCIIISLVRSNNENQTGHLLRDWRRLNVTFTRAMSKIIIFGSKKTLKDIEIFKKFLTLINKKKWEYSLPEKAHLMHQFNKC